MLHRIARSASRVTGHRLFTSCAAPDIAVAVHTTHLVDSAAALLRRDGSEAFDLFRVAGSAWCDGDTYLFAYDYDLNVLFNAAAPEKEGTNVGGHPDAKGKLFHDAFVRAAKLEEAAARTRDETFEEPPTGGTGTWVDYKWPRPNTTEPVLKMTYVRAVRIDGKGAALMSGIYLDEDEGDSS